MTRVSKVTTAQEAAVVFNEHEYRSVSNWRVWGSGFSVVENSAGTITRDEAIVIANQVSGYNAQTEEDLAALLQAGEAAISRISCEAECGCNQYQIKRDLAAVIAGIKEK